MRQAIRFTELLPERELPLKMPTIVGAPPAKAVSAYARSLFYAELRDIVVTSQSTLLEVEGGLLYDFQARELEAVPIDFRFDTVVFDARDGTADIVRIGRIEQEIAEAISLVGSSSHAFGHWVSEYLLKFFVLEHAGVAPNAPILIDAGMPIQHREALEFFSYGRHPIIEVPSFSSVRVDKLWVCATFAFVPIMPKPGHAADPSSCSLHAAWFAALLRGVRKPERSLDPSRRRLFLSRRPTSKRNLENLSEVEEICQKRGFVSVYPEDLPFDEQLFLLHNATHVVGPSGSALISPILYGNPSMKMLAFRPPFVEDAPIWASIADARGMEVLVILGDVCRKDPHFRLNSDYRVDPVIVERALTTWGL